MPDPTPLDPLDAWRTYIEASLRLHGRLDQLLRSAVNLSLMDYNVLLALIDTEGHALRMGDLARLVDFSPSRLTYQVNSMEQRGWLIREKNRGDRRVTIARLTGSGVAAFHEAWAHHRVHVNALLLDHIDNRDAADLHRIFSGVMRRVVAEQDAEAPERPEAQPRSPGR